MFSIIKDIKNIYILNNFHSRIILIILYFEKKIRFNIIFKILRKLINQAIYHCEIYPDSLSIESLVSLRLPHPYNIVIHKTGKIGNYCTIFQNVTIGVIETKEIKAATIHDNVYIGCNSVILGNITINKNVKIGAMSLILKDIEPNLTIVGTYK